MLFTVKVSECKTPNEMSTTVNELINRGEELVHDRSMRNRGRKRKMINTQIQLAIAKCARLDLSLKDTDPKLAAQWGAIGKHLKDATKGIKDIQEVVSLEIDWL